MKKKGAPTTRAISTAMRRFRKRFLAILKSEVFKRCVEVGILFAALASFIANAFVAKYQHAANKIYRGQETIYQEQAAIASDTEQRELRAYLHASVATVQISGSPSIPTEVRFTVTNDGQTPAHALSIRSALIFDTYPLTDTVVLKHPDKEPPEAKAYLASRSSMDGIAVFAGTITKNQAMEMAANTNRLYLFGDIAYDDIFNIERHIRFGFSFGGTPAKSALAAKHFPLTMTGDFEWEPHNNYEY